MSQYVITIIPVGGDDDFAGPVSQTIVRIDADSGRTWVKEITMRAADGSGLSDDDIPQVDYAMLVRAFNPQGAVPASGTPGPATEAVAARSVQSRPPAVSAKPAPAVRGAGRAGAAKAGRLRTGRAYRRAPSAQELENAYEQTGTIAGVASHFGVPVHTAQGWISRLRRDNAELAGG